jgi:hypothetical protein
VIDTFAVHSRDRGADVAPYGFRQRPCRKRRAQSSRLRDALRYQVAPIGPPFAAVKGRHRFRHMQAALRKKMEQAPLSKRAHSILVREPVAILRNSRDQAAAAVMPQHPARGWSDEPSRTSAAGNAGQFAARRPKIRIEQRFGSIELCIAKALGISQHDARCGGSALAAL